MNMVGHNHVCEEPESVLAASLSDVLKTKVAFARDERGDAAHQIRRHKEIPAGVLDPAQARHGRIVM